MGFAGSLKDAQIISTGNDFVVPRDGGIPAFADLEEGRWVAIRGPTNWTSDGGSPSLFYA